jgi:hypothetical protein
LCRNRWKYSDHRLCRRSSSDGTRENQFHLVYAAYQLDCHNRISGRNRHLLFTKPDFLAPTQQKFVSLPANDKIMQLTAGLKQFIRAHLTDNTDKLLLAASRFPGIDIRFAIDQIIARRQIQHKLPFWYEQDELIFPLVHRTVFIGTNRPV